jgi:hypothetical protein
VQAIRADNTPCLAGCQSFLGKWRQKNLPQKQLFSVFTIDCATDEGAQSGEENKAQTVPALC